MPTFRVANRSPHSVGQGMSSLADAMVQAAMIEARRRPDVGLGALNAARADTERAQSGLYGAQEEAARALARQRGAEFDQSVAQAQAIRQRNAFQTPEARDRAFLSTRMLREPDVAAALDYIAGRMVEAPFGRGMTGGIDEGIPVAPPEPAPRPSNLTPDVEAALLRHREPVAHLAGIPGISIGGEDVAAVSRDLARRDAIARMGGGGKDPYLTSIATMAADGKPLLTTQGDNIIDLSRRLVTPTEQGNAEIRLRGAQVATEGTKQTENRAQAGAAAAAAAASRANAERIQEDTRRGRRGDDLIPIPGLTNPDGSPVLARRSVVEPGIVGTAFGDRRYTEGGAQPRPWTPSSADSAAMTEAISQLAPNLPAQHSALVSARARALMMDANGAAFRNPIEAVRMALEQGGARDAGVVRRNRFELSNPGALSEAAVPSPQAPRPTPPGRAAVQSQARPPQIRGDEDYARLPSGSRFIDPEGKVRVKP